ncbi:MAG: hypothetical protein AAB834_01250 [Patescibacteria group bacterium]
MASRHERRPHQRRPDDKEIAQQRGVYGVYRRIAPGSVPIIGEAIEALAPEVQNAGRLFSPDSVTVTVVGFSRFSPRHIRKGPKTRDVVERVGSLCEEMPAVLGSLAVFGSGNNYKLSFNLDSDRLKLEEYELADTFEDLGGQMLPCNNEAGVYMPHLSVAKLQTDHVGFFEDERTLDRLNSIVEASIGRAILLQPINHDTI